MKTIISIIILLFPTALWAQETKKIKQQEVGITLSSWDNFGGLYRFGTNKAMWQINAFTIDGQNENYNGLDENSVAFGLQLGREFRQAIDAKIELRYGGGVSIGYSSSYIERNDTRFAGSNAEQKKYEPGIYFLLGANYLINDRIILGAELIPHFSYFYSQSEEEEVREQIIVERTEIKNYGFNYGLNTNSIRLSLAYRFIKN